MIKKGSNRWVFIFNKLVFKIPSLYSWKNFLWGLLANIQEKEFSRIHDMNEKLCPIIFSLPLGILVVMPRVRVLNEGELSIEILEKFCRINNNYIIPSELKYDSFGYFKGKLVAIDYG